MKIIKKPNLKIVYISSDDIALTIFLLLLVLMLFTTARLSRKTNCSNDMWDDGQPLQIYNGFE